MVLVLAAVILSPSDGRAWNYSACAPVGTPVIADLDGDGGLEVVFVGNEPTKGCGLFVIDAAGKFRWELPGIYSGWSDLTPVLADVDGDPKTREILVVHQTVVPFADHLTVVSHTGAVLGSYDPPGGLATTPLVIDADLDGVPEIYIAED